MPLPALHSLPLGGSQCLIINLFTHSHLHPRIDPTGCPASQRTSPRDSLCLSGKQSDVLLKNVPRRLRRLRQSSRARTFVISCGVLRALMMSFENTPPVFLLCSYTSQQQQHRQTTSVSKCAAFFTNKEAIDSAVDASWLFPVPRIPGQPSVLA